MSDLRNVRVVIRFADAEAAQAARISQINVVTVLGPNEVIDEIERVYECRVNAGPTVVVEPEWPVCSLCGDYIHKSSDAFPDDDRWYDTSGDPTCPDRLRRRADGAVEGLPHVFDGKTRPADTAGDDAPTHVEVGIDDIRPIGGADDAETTQH